MEINQVYKAPSIPKLSTRNISSSVLRTSSAVSSSAASPRLRTSKFSFFKAKPKVDLEQKLETLTPENILPTSKSDVKLYKTLAETNQILVEIQKQLSLDYSTRIAEEKEILKRTKTAESKRKFAAKEKSVESVKKFGDFANNIVGKVTAPIKSVFDKIKEFFQLILLGIVTNTVFTWLGDPANREKLDTIFKWVGRVFTGLLLGVIIGKFIKWGIRFFKLARWLWRLPGRLLKVVKGLLKLPGKIKEALGLKPKPTGPSPKPILPNKPLGRMNESYSKFIQGTSNIGDRLRLLKRGMIGPQQLFTKGSFEALQGTVKNFPKPSGASFARGLSRGVAGIGLELGGSYAIQKALEPIGQKTLSDTINRINSYDPRKKAETIEKINRNIKKEKEYQSSPLHSLDKFIAMTGGSGLTQSEMKLNFDLSLLKSLGETPKFSQGGTVPGKGSGFVDSVRALLAPGEEVIKTTSSMLFRPLLKDINDNAGRLWTLFSQAVLKLIRVSDRQKEVSEQFSKVIKDFDRFVQNEIDKQMMSGRPLKDFFNTPPIVAGAPRLQTQSTKASFSRISMPPRSVSSSPQSSGGGINFIPMNLPVIQTPPPQIPTPQTTATDVPIISSVNMANPYMQLTPEMYGIFV